MANRERRSRPQTVLQVLSTQALSPHLIRVWVGGAAMAGFEDNGYTDHYVKIWFAKPELGLTPPYDLDALRETLDPADLPVTRTYSIAVVEPDRLAIDFVYHGAEGLAGPWAASAKPGDLIAFMGPGGAYSPDPEADSHLFAGDESAIPAISAALADLADKAPESTGAAYLEVDGPADELRLVAPTGLSVHWLHRDGAPAGTSTVLSDAVAAHSFDGRVQVFAHGEREAMKRIRAVVKERQVPAEDLSLSGYWAYGRTEDRFQAEKREPIGVV